VAKFVGDIKKGGKELKEGDQSKLIALLALGEIGRQRDLADQKEIDVVIFSAFESKVDNVKQAASFALGNITVGNMSRFLPGLLELIKRHQDRRYLLFSSLKEIIQQHSVYSSAIELFRPHVRTVAPILFENTDAKDEGIRGMIAACIGRLLIVDSAEILPRLEQLVGSTSPYTRAVVITALRSSFSPEAMKGISIVLGPKLELFLALVADPDLEVRRQTSLTVNALLRANESLIRKDTLEKLVLPNLYSATPPKAELVTEIDFGAFRRFVDSGLPLRKAAFLALETLLEVAPHRVNMQEFIKYIQHGLVEEYDLQISTLNFFRKTLAPYHASSLLEVLDSLPNLILKSVQEHLKAVKLQPGADPVLDPLKAGDALRAFVQAIVRFNQIPGVDLNKKYTHFVQQVFATPYLKTVMEEFEKK